MAFADWERFNRYPISGLGYLSVLGISGILAVPGLFFALKKYRPAWTGIVLWYLFPFAGLMLPPDFLPVSNGRFLQSAGYIPAAILGALAVTEPVIRLKTGKAIAIAAVTVVFVALSLPSFAASIRRQEYYIARNASNPEVFVPRTTMEGLEKLSEGAGGILVAPRDVSVLAPAFTSYRVVAGHPTFTLRQGEKERGLSSFFAGDDAFREEFLAKYPADAVWLPEGQVNMSWLDGMGYAKVYGNSTLTVYEKK